MNSLARNTTRAILGILFAAAANYITNYVIERIFGPEDDYED